MFIFTGERNMQMCPTETQPIGDWTAREVAKFLNVSVQTVYNLARNGSIPAVRISPKKLLFEQVLIKEWVEKRKTGYAVSSPSNSSKSVSN